MTVEARAKRKTPDSAPQIVGEDIFLPKSASGVRLHLRRKCSVLGAARDGRSVVVFVHGATYHGTAAFDAPLPGGSWLDYAAAQGHDVYALDIRGYGESTRPSAEAGGAGGQGPYARTEEAVADLSEAVDHILARTGADRVDLVGWSWGTAICAGYAAQNPHEVGRIVMIAPLWILRNLPGAGLPQVVVPLVWFPGIGSMYAANLRPFRNVCLDDARRRWFRGLDERTARELVPEEVLERWWQHTVSADPVGEAQSPTVVRAPNGVMADLMERWAVGRPTYDPAEIKVPVLAIVGEWDIDTPPEMARELFGRLTAAPYKRLELLARGTHAMLLEVNRFDLYQRVQQFLETDFAG